MLVVDNDTMAVEWAKAVLGGEFEVATATDGAQALRWLRNRGADVVLCDLFMPGLSGMDVIGAIQGDSPDTVVIAISATEELSKAVDAVRKGAYDFVKKPVRPDILRERVRRAVEHGRLLGASNLFDVTRAAYATRHPAEVAPALVAALRTALRASAVGVLTMDADRRVAARLLEGSATEIQPVHRFVARCRKPMRLPAKTPATEVPIGPRAMIVPLRLGSGRPAWVVAVRPPNDPVFVHRDLERMGVASTQIGLAMDNNALVTVLRRRIAELNSARTELATVGRASGLGHLAMSIANELYAPVQYATTNLREAQDLVDELDDVPEELFEHLDYAAEGLDRLTALAADLAAASRTDLRDYELNQAVGFALRMVPTAARERVVQLLVPATLRGNPALLALALAELVGSAHRARPDAQIQLCAAMQDDWVVLSVSHGLDIVGQDPATGLRMVFGIVEQHGGTARLVEAGDGSEIVVIELPAKPVDVMALDAT